MQDSAKTSVLVISRDRPTVLKRCLETVLEQAYQSLEVLVLDDCSETCDLEDKLGTEVQDSRLRWYRSPRRLGVAGGRNFLIDRAEGEYLIFLDDDAWLTEPGLVSRVEEYFAGDPALAGLAFHIVLRTNDEQDGKLQLPFPRRARREEAELTARTRRCSYYVGAGHALRSSTIRDVGSYHSDLMFYIEELDLSYRLLQAGYHLAYAPDLKIVHEPQPSALSKGARGAWEEFYYSSRNRIWFAYQYLPLRYLPVHLGTWVVRFGIDALRGRGVAAYLRGVGSGLRGMIRQTRTVLSPETVSYLRAHHGRLWY